MKKTLEEKVVDFTSELNEEIVNLEHKKDEYSEVRVHTLREVVDWLEVLIYAEEFEKFRKRHKDANKPKSKINRKAIYVTGICRELEHIDDEILMMECNRLKYNKDKYTKRELLNKELERVKKMNKDDVLKI